ncbi:UDP-glucuronosyl/UDP-glucosyltransferase [Parasponia andersonii]|uniref:Glycosyltransferase n=1 Tax=Parasponia andersonii TaxID=3476 RepID=A0A2P5DN34_PARAD|nr:UDP-glucuronosyl/UDP-glucosyltransferase [Parasponia andersonii]
MGLETPFHVLLVSFPAQGHVNPLLRLGKRLAAKGLLVTFSTTEIFGREMSKASNDITDQPTPVGDGFIRFEFFNDGIPEDHPQRPSLDFFFPQLELAGRESLPELIKKQSDEGRPVSCLVNNPFIPWVCDVAEELGIPCATLWIQSCALFASFYHYSHRTVAFPSQAEPEIDVRLPGMPVLKHDEISSFLHPSTPYKALANALLGQFKNLSKSFCVLADTFEELERDIIKEVSKFCPVKSIGPLFKDPRSPNDSTNKKADDNDDCIEWLDSKPPLTVVYISFGTIVYLKQEQVDEIAHALLNSGVSFLWVMKPPPAFLGRKLHVLPDGFLERAGDKAKVVKWSPQERVLAHPSVTCFMTHCGWNSTVESLTSGVPVLTFPRWGDQVTNAKFLVDVFGVGVRLSRGEAEDRVVPRDEIEKCLIEATEGEKAGELRRNALKWKSAAEEAVVEGGSSDQNIRDFIEEIGKKSSVDQRQD